ncbi:tetratricopeptide repeat protein [Rhodanobacter sp. BL-MT-08]
MTPGIPQRLTQTQRKELESAHQLLRHGHANDAVALVRRVLNDAPHSADALLLLAMCLADVGDVPGAEAGFLRALENAPHHPDILFNFGTWLSRQGRTQAAIQSYHAATAIKPNFVDAWIKLGILMLEQDNFVQAAGMFQRAVDLQPHAAHAWQGLGRAKQSLGDLDAAVEALRKATNLSPSDGSPWVDLGVTLRSLGRLEDSLASFEHARELGATDPGVPDAIIDLLGSLGRMDEALEQGRRLVDDHPQFVPGQVKLARLLWSHDAEREAESDPFSTMRSAIRQQPANRALQTEFVVLLIEARRGQEALDLVRVMRRSNSSDLFLVWLEALACDSLLLHEQAGSLFAQAYPVLGSRSADFLNAYVRHLYRSGDWEAVARYANEAIVLDSANQESWAHLGTAWRLAGDPREHWLMNYEQLIGLIEVDLPPPPSSDVKSLEALKATLDGMHRSTRDPLNQSVRHGSQTSGHLFARPDPTIAAARLALQASAERWLTKLPVDQSHPFLSRNNHGVRMMGSWSVELRSFGHHVNHFHQDGWMSSAFYVSLPPSVNQGTEADAGCIQFGQPALELGLDLSPRRIVRPKAGYLALFPSYMWHGTLPFSDAEPRTTIAFDMQPTAAQGKG